jgi:hypothetical protein
MPPKDTAADHKALVSEVALAALAAAQSQDAITNAVMSAGMSKEEMQHTQASMQARGHRPPIARLMGVKKEKKEKKKPFAGLSATFGMSPNLSLPSPPVTSSHLDVNDDLDKIFGRMLSHSNINLDGFVDMDFDVLAPPPPPTAAPPAAAGAAAGGPIQPGAGTPRGTSPFPL